MPCYHDNVTERAWGYGHSFNNAMNIMEHIAGEIDNFLDWSNDDVLSIVGGCIITVGVAMFLVSNPIGWATLGAIGLIAVGGALIYYANDLNNGWSNERWLSFSIDLSLSIIPAGGMTTKIGKTILTKPLSKQTVTTLISKNSKNIPYELDLMSELGISGTIYKGYNTYILFGNGERIYYNAFGFTRYERMVNFIKDRIKDIFSDILINSYSNE